VGRVQAVTTAGSRAERVEGRILTLIENVLRVKQVFTVFFGREGRAYKRPLKHDCRYPWYLARG